MKNRVLHLIGSFHQGGSESQAVSLASMLRYQGEFEIHLAALNNQGPLRSDAFSAGFTEIAEYALTSFFDVRFIRQVKMCVEYLRENEIDIVHTHDFYTNVFGMTAASIAGVPGRIASKRETTGVRTSLQNTVEGIAFYQAHRIVANSKRVRDFLSSRVKANKIEVVYNGVDLARFERGTSEGVRASFGVSANPPSHVITLVANLRHEVKNVPMLLRAATKVLATFPDAHFVIAGEGELENKLKKLAEELGIAQRVRFMGRCSDVPSLLVASDICVLTSTAEGFSNSILEYMAAGKPVVATDVGGANEVIVDGKTGYLLESDDDQALADGLIDLLLDEKKAAAFGQRGREVVAEKFSRGAQMQKTLELYRSLLGQ